MQKKNILECYTRKALYFLVFLLYYVKMSICIKVDIAFSLHHF